MLCDNCKEREVEIHLTKVENDTKVTLHLCKQCAQQRGLKTGGSILWRNASPARELGEGGSGTAPAQDTSGVRFPPPLIYVAGFLIGYLLHRAVPLTLASWSSRKPLGWALVCVGTLLMASAVIAFRRAGTTPIPTRPTTTVVVHGPYRFTRNPMYLGWVIVYLGAVLLTNTVWPLALLPVVLVLINRAVIAREERYLEAKFGDAYRAYRDRVRRWL
jgi:protein-S-isoprenylcysteine O-methyltransferase Ste14